jgi:disulfide bond formation protein DsbB
MSTELIRQRLDALGARALYFAVAAASLGLIAAALFMQHVVGLNPCPLCILQRVAYFFLALLTLLATWRSPRPGARGFGVAGLIVALVGAGVAAWHVRLKNAPELLSCGPGLGAMLENFPLTQVLPRIFRGSGDCADPTAVLMGVSLPAWSLAGFLFLALVVVAAMARR